MMKKSGKKMNKRTAVIIIVSVLVGGFLFGGMVGHMLTVKLYNKDADSTIICPSCGAEIELDQDDDSTAAMRRPPRRGRR